MTLLVAPRWNLIASLTGSRFRGWNEIVLPVAEAAMVGLEGGRAMRQWSRGARRSAPTFVFADLVGYTALTEKCGDQEAARIAREFKRAMTALSREHGAWQIKSLGDGAMILAPDPSQAVALAGRALEEVGTRPDLLPVRVGAHTGPAVMDGGDWFGRAVNVAARLAAEAEPNEALISYATGSPTPESSSTCRELILRGMQHPVSAWRLRSSAASHELVLADLA